MADREHISVLTRVVEIAGILSDRHLMLLLGIVDMVTAAVLVWISASSSPNHSHLRLLSIALQTLVMKVNLGLFPGTWLSLMWHEAWLGRVH